jgi:hypothetical protein
VSLTMLVIYYLLLAIYKINCVPHWLCPKLKIDTVSLLVDFLNIDFQRSYHVHV